MNTQRHHDHPQVTMVPKKFSAWERYRLFSSGAAPCAVFTLSGSLRYSTHASGARQLGMRGISGSDQVQERPAQVRPCNGVRGKDVVTVCVCAAAASLRGNPRRLGTCQIVHAASCVCASPGVPVSVQRVNGGTGQRFRFAAKAWKRDGVAMPPQHLHDPTVA